jgi:transposase
VVVYTLASLAQRARRLDGEVRDLHRRITDTVRCIAPDLLQVRGIAADSAATLLVVAGDNPHRLTSEASFAALCGVSPVQASSGRIQRHRLNRGGHRQANAALFRAALTGLRWDPQTQAYLQRRTTEGLSKREIIRCLKRYIARIVYKIITATGTITAAASPA